MTSVVPPTPHTHSVTYVADNILKSLKDIVRLERARSRQAYRRLGDEHARPESVARHRRPQSVSCWRCSTQDRRPDLRWDIDVVYNWSSAATAASGPTPTAKYHIRKAGLAPADANYDILMQNKPGRPTSTAGDTALRSTDGLVRQAWARPSTHTGSGAARPTGGGQLMLTVDEAFRKFKSRLELNDKEQANASARQNEVRDYLGPNSPSTAASSPAPTGATRRLSRSRTSTSSSS